MLGRDDNVAGKGDFKSTPQRKAIHRRDNRLENIVTRGYPCETTLRPHGLLTAMLRGPAQVIPGGKRLVARAGRDSNPHRTVGDEIIPHLIHLHMARGM